MIPPFAKTRSGSAYGIPEPPHLPVRLAAHPNGKGLRLMPEALVFSVVELRGLEPLAS